MADEINGTNGHAVAEGGVDTELELELRGPRDDGASRDLRVNLCVKLAWCVGRDGHEGECVVVGERSKSQPVKGPR